MFSLRNLTFSYGKRIFSDLTLEIRRGELVRITGPNGSGKTSLLRLLAGLIPGIYSGNWQGELLFQGKPLEESQLRERCAVTGSWAAARFFCHSVWEEVTFTWGSSPERAEELLRYFGIWDLRDRNPLKISGGQQQLVLLTAYLSGNRDILFLDEIYAQLSREKAQLLTALLKERHHEGSTILMVDHKLPPEIASLARRVELKGEPLPEAVSTGDLRPCKKEFTIQWEEVQPLQNQRALFSPLTGELQPSELLHIEGDIGSGKSSFLRALAGLLPYKGEILFDGKEGRQLTWKERAEIIGMVSQLSDDKFFCSTLEKEIYFGPRKLKTQDSAWLDNLIRSCGLDHLRERSPLTLSHGEMKRLQLAIALSSQPGILLLDEPETNLDSASRNILEKLINQYLAMGNSIVLVSHSLQITGSRKITLEGGRL